MKWSKQKETNYHKLQWVAEKGLIGLIEEICGGGESFLELGCGTGVLIDRIAQNYRRSVGVDPSTSLLEKAPRREGIEYRAVPLEEIEDTDAFDTVVLRNTLHHVKDPVRAIEVAHRALRPGGMLVVCEGVPPSSQVRDFYERLFKLFDGRHIFNEGDLIAMLRMCRFEQILLRPYFMESVNLIDWLWKVSADEEVAQKALRMHKEGDAHFRRVYEVYELNGQYTMTWRFAVMSGVKA